MKGLMLFCKNWGSENCHPEIRELKMPKEIKDGDSIPLWPTQDEAKEFDHICKTCESGQFDIEENRCPICGDDKLFLIGEDVVNAQPIYNYRCSKCKARMSSYEKFN